MRRKVRSPLKEIKDIGLDIRVAFRRTDIKSKINKGIKGAKRVIKTTGDRARKL